MVYWTMVYVPRAERRHAGARLTSDVTTMARQEVLPSASRRWTQVRLHPRTYPGRVDRAPNDHPSACGGMVALLCHRSTGAAAPPTERPPSVGMGTLSALRRRNLPSPHELSPPKPPL